MDSVQITVSLIERFRQGDHEAFTSLFENYQRRLAVLIHFKLSLEKQRPENVDEILQETFMAAFEDRAQFQYRSAGSFMNWISRIADHVIVDAARHENRQKRRAVEVLRFRSESHPQGADPPDSRTPSRFLAQREAMDALVKKLNALPEQYREVILLAKVEGLSSAEMSERLGKSREATALLLHRAIERFRKLQDHP